MARHVIQIPINKSSNTAFSRGATIYIKAYDHSNEDIKTIIPVPAVSNSLYCVRDAYNLRTNMGLAWDASLIPTNKIIVSAKLYLHSIQSHNRVIYYKYADFNEGSTIAFNNPSDGAKSNGMPAGWGSIDIGELKGNSIVLLADLQRVVNNIPAYYEAIGEVWEVSSHRNSNNKPYLEITYDDIPPGNPKSLYPSNITLNPRDVIKFSWLHDTKEDEQQKGFSLQYSINSGSTWTTVSQTTAEQFYDMPANILPTSGTVIWRVKTTDTNNTDSGYTTASFTLGVVPQKAPIPISPISQYIDENNPIRFEWAFTGGSGNETQSKFDLQYSTNSGSTWTTKTVTSADNYYTLPANTLTGGNITWRVRTCNNWNEVSPYSENRSFTVIGSPPIPQILTVTNKSRPTITWQSTGQHIYELEILKDNKVIFKTGSIPSSVDRSFKLENYLEDGNYFVKLRIFNEYNLYSPWAEKSFTISTIKPLEPIIDIYSGEYSVTIKTSNTSLKTYVYRENILLGEVINNTFIDYTGENNKEYKYFVRTIDNDENFKDSTLKLAKCNFSGNTLSLAHAPDKFIKLKHGFGNIAKKSNRNGVVGSLSYYDGRENPVVDFTEFKTKEKSLSFFLKTKEELDKLNELIDKRKTLLYRDNNGENIYGVTFVIDDDKTMFGYEVGFTIIKTEV